MLTIDDIYAFNEAHLQRMSNLISNAELQDCSTSNQVKASTQRAIRGRWTFQKSDSAGFDSSGGALTLCCAAKILELYPLLAETHAIDVILPKKESAVVAKWQVVSFLHPVSEM